MKKSFFCNSAFFNYSFEELIAATALPYTLAGLTYGLAGLAYSNVFQDGSSEFKYNEKYGSIEFERNPFAFSGSFATGQVINYSKNNHADDVDDYGYYVNELTNVHLGAHERHHIEQSNTYGIIFPFVYFFLEAGELKKILLNKRLMKRHL